MGVCGRIGSAPVGCAFGPVEPLAGFLVAEELFFNRVPLKLAMVPISQVAQMTHGNRPAADLHVANGSFAGPHAVQEILGKAVAVVEPDGIGAQRFGVKALGSRLELAAIDQDPAFRAGIPCSTVAWSRS